MSWFREYVKKPLTRSKGWRKTRNKHIKKHPYCAICGREKGLEAHHRKPFKDFPELELDPTNLVTLCRRYPWLKGRG